MGSYDSYEWDEIRPIRSVSGGRSFNISDSLRQHLRDEGRVDDVATQYNFNSEPFDTIVAFDVTGSMGPYIGYVRETTEYFAKGLIKLLDTRVGFVGVGDHCDGPNMLQYAQPTNDLNLIKNNINSIRNTSGGDAPEAYECLFKELRQWNYEHPTIMFLIGDSIPHNMAGFPVSLDNGCPDKVNYKEELRGLKKKLKSFYFINVGQDQLMADLQKNLVDSDEYHINMKEAWNSTNVLMSLVMKEVGELDQWMDVLEIQRGSERKDEILQIIGGGV